MKGQSTAIAHVQQASGATNNPRISHALQIIGGNFSAEIAEFFPFPHSEFLERSSIWMHLVGLTFANPIASNHKARVIFDFLVDSKDAAALACPDLDHDKISLIKKLPLPLWEKAQYRALCRLLRCEKAVKIMRHRSKITPDLVAILDALPAEFRRHNFMKFISSADEAKLINKLFQRFNQFDQKSTADALEKVDDVERFWERASERFFAEIRSIPTGPAIDDDRVQPILTLRELVSKSREFRNCLSNYIIEMATGEIGFLPTTVRKRRSFPIAAGSILVSSSTRSRARITGLFLTKFWSRFEPYFLETGSRCARTIQ